VAEHTEKENQQQALEPLEQEAIPFHGEQIVAVRLPDSRICVVLRWICGSLALDPQAQVRRIERTASTASELVRVRVQTRGGKQVMPAITLRGFSPWVLGINPSEVRSDNSTEDERIRALIVAYQEEAKDVLYEYFVAKQRPALSSPRATTIPAEPTRPLQEPQADATEAEQATYYEQLGLWYLWKAAQHAQAWREEVNAWRGSVESRLESKEAMLDLIPEILERLGPEMLTMQHQRQLQAYVRRLHEASAKAYATVYDDLKTAFGKPRYQELLESEWPDVERWFTAQIERAKGKPR
jgi:P22_AR N-terminal domain